VDGDARDEPVETAGVVHRPESDERIGDREHQKVEEKGADDQE
jgi:hypothetical protein